MDNSFNLILPILINAYKMSTQRDENISIPSFIRHHNETLRQLVVVVTAPIICSLHHSELSYFLSNASSIFILFLSSKLNLISNYRKEIKKYYS